jgi:multiple RNA-binding domain-containing protein 1
VGDTALPRPWSRHSLKKEVTNNAESKKDIGALNSSQAKVSDGQDFSDPKLQEFLHVMQPRSKSKIWENDINGINSFSSNSYGLPLKKMLSLY